MPYATLTMYRTAEPQTQPCAPPPPKRPTKRATNEFPDPKPISLLFVDTNNQTRSIIAHATAELLRLQTLNSGRANLFTRLDSAGLNVNPKTYRAKLAALRALFPPARASPEEQDVLGRMQGRESRGVETADFTRYGFVLAFDRDDVAVLGRLREQERARDPEGGEARIVLLGDGSGVESPRSVMERAEKRGGKVEAEEAYAVVVKQVWVAVERFLERECAWQRPERTIDDRMMPLRSRQFMGLRFGVPDIKVKHMKETGDWKIAIDEAAVEGAENVVTVTAAKDKLDEALYYAEKVLKKIY
ncbi:hypothetical protein AOQ84DRAFT_439094 [Glonium stellatum]|uniref:Uncharacterized protein n=1 Tax=Glonium stellatum TaxID=574774 RepID=A0A8E2JTS5_9PEZI|nr:hypothetical protein AOQ84DRAFT_439094 [Glonium stellatum]